MRCPNCNVFVPYDTEVDPEEQALGTTIAKQAVDITAEVRRVLTCESCGEELKDLNLIIDAQVERPCNCEGIEYDADGEYTPTTETQTTDRDGKPVRNRRAIRTLYGVTATFTITCPKCSAKATVEASAADYASAFDELT